jgi:hypothetical protein
MSKDRKVRNFDFLKQTPPPLPSREEVIQKTAELTGQSVVGEELTPSVSAPIEVVSAPVEVVTVPVITTPISTPIITPVSAPSPPPVVVVEKVVEVPAEVVVVPTPIAATVEKEKKAIQKKVKTVEVPLAVAAPAEKSKVGRKALVDTRKPFTTTITVDNKKRLRQLCAEYDIAMSDVINEILSAHFDQRAPSF